MTRICLIASGGAYRHASSLAALTFKHFLTHPDYVSVYLPQEEAISDDLLNSAKIASFELRRFTFKPVSLNKLVSQLKCQAFLQCVSDCAEGDIVFIVDADTYACAPLSVSEEVKKELLEGKVGLVPDTLDRHINDPAFPWFVPKEGRPAYVNSGVIAANRSSLDIFQKFAELSSHPDFLWGPFNDQKVVNFAMAKFYPHRLLLLDKKYNGLPAYRDHETIIGHLAGGAGGFNREGCTRRIVHEERCREIISKFSTRERFPAGVDRAL